MSVTVGAGADIWLVRHARPLIPAGVCYGSTDVPADLDATRHAASALGLLLPPDTQVLCSPLQRCTRLADALLDTRADLSWRTDTRLAEMDFGTWEGWRWDDIPKAAIDEWTAQFGTWRFGGAQSVNELMQRVGAVWQETLLAARPTAWICHAGVVRAAVLHAQGVLAVNSSAFWPHAGPGFGEVVRLQRVQSKRAPL